MTPSKPQPALYTRILTAKTTPEVADEFLRMAAAAGHNPGEYLRRVISEHVANDGCTLRLILERTEAARIEIRRFHESINPEADAVAQLDADRRASDREAKGVVEGLLGGRDA